ncbi:unnamed protein product [Adineta ricciae]|uniref:Uncharacterized protein n=1 Tax=Adineta ricciae TaxID=249248 RepID=A0A815C7Y7_ADIRI|nr:unnamed protein product [Adineta ricciae]CAF1283645.1 unnamed protein product [Adineta ricciae]
MKLAIISGIVLFAISLTAHVHGQTCHGISQYGQCSSNRGCGCLHFSLADDVGICAVLGLNCTRLSPCQWPDDTCEKADHVCVRHPHCNSNPLCYPLHMVNQRLCPSSSISLPTTTTTTTTMAPISDFVISYYSNILTTNSDRFPYSHKHYHQVRIVAYASGLYNFTSISYLNTFAYLYRGAFDPYNASLNLITDGNYNYQTNQFELAAFLRAGSSYVLVFTTDTGNTTGYFTIAAYGPNYLHFISMNSTQNSTMTWNNTTSQNAVMSEYSSVLTSNSEKFTRLVQYGFTADYNYTMNYSSTPLHYYEAIRITVYRSGYYRLTSASNFDSYGQLYTWYFDPNNPSMNLFYQDDDAGGNSQFQISAYLQAGVSYILVFTTYGEGQLGSFRVVATGPNYVGFVSVAIPTTQTSTRPTFTSVGMEHGVISDYSSMLTSNSEKFSRFVQYGFTADYNYTMNYSSTPLHYYEAIRITVYTSGHYRLKSASNFDSYGQLYTWYFDPNNPSMNLFYQDDDAGGNRQFQISAYLQAGVLYILVFTTFGEGQLGSFRVVATGPNYLRFIQANINNATVTTSTPPRSSIITTNYSYALTSSSEKYPGTNSYYQAIQISVSKPGFYNFSSESHTRSRWCLYWKSFILSNLTQNQMTCADGYNDSNFQVSDYFSPEYSYVLVYRALAPNRTGPFSIVVTGPDYVQFVPIYTSQTTTMMPNNMVLVYSSELTLNNDRYSRAGRTDYFTADYGVTADYNSFSNFFYEAIQLSITATGTYTFISRSSIDTFGYIYHDHFEPANPEANIQVEDDESGGSNQFKMTTYLYANRLYVLVVTTWVGNTIGPFSIVVEGQHPIGFNRLYYSANKH